MPEQMPKRRTRRRKKKFRWKDRHFPGRGPGYDMGYFPWDGRSFKRSTQQEQFVQESGSAMAKKKIKVVASDDLDNWDASPKAKELLRRNKDKEVRNKNRRIDVDKPFVNSYGKREPAMKVSKESAAYEEVAKKLSPKLKLLVDKNGHNVAKKLYQEYIGDEDWGNYAHFMWRLDQLLLKMGGKPEGGEEEEKEEKGDDEPGGMDEVEPADYLNKGDADSDATKPDAAEAALARLEDYHKEESKKALPSRVGAKVKHKVHGHGVITKQHPKKGYLVQWKKKGQPDSWHHGFHLSSPGKKKAKKAKKKVATASTEVAASPKRKSSGHKVGSFVRHKDTGYTGVVTEIKGAGPKTMLKVQWDSDRVKDGWVQKHHLK